MSPIRAARLTIRRFTLEDLDAVVRVHDDCFGPAPLMERRAWLEWAVRNYHALAQLRQPPYGDYAVTLNATGEVIGAVGLVPSFGPFGKLPGFRPEVDAAGAGTGEWFTTEMGLFWAIDAAHRRAGYAAEAAAALAGYAFGELRVARLVATTEHANAASVAVMRRLGMRVERNPGPEPAWFQTVGVLVNPLRQSPPPPR